MLEKKIINKLFSKTVPNDDCFNLKNQYIITTDTITEGTHFLHNWSSPKQIAEKLVEVNISDITASGGTESGFAFLNLGLNNISSSEKWINEFAKNFKKRLKKYNHFLSGGDTYFSQNTNLTLTLISENKNPILRSTAKKGDKIYITGSIGYSILGYKILKNQIKLHDTKLKIKCINKHLSPKSKFFELKSILKINKINSMMDITDGLVQDSKRLAIASKVDLIIKLDKLKNFSSLNKILSIEDIINSGEELELLFTSSDDLSKNKNCIEIGEVIKGNGKVNFFLNDTKFIPKEKGFLHF